MYRVRVVTNQGKGIRTEVFKTKREALRAIPSLPTHIIKMKEKGSPMYIVYTRN
jgi:hypothetical protein